MTPSSLIHTIASAHGCRATVVPADTDPSDADIAILDVLKDAPAEYPRDLFLARRIAFTRQIEAKNGLQARCEAIEEALRDPFMDKETAFELLNELAEIQITQETE